MTNPLNFVFIGRSGSGKGTQAELLLKQFPNLRCIVVGELFRALSQKDTDTGRRIREVLAQGGLPFDDLATTLWMHEIAFTVKEDEGILLDGAPRRVPEAKNLDRFLEFLNRRERLFVLFLDVTREEAERRLLARGRADDTHTAIAGRLDYFDEHVTPAINFYRGQGRLIEINGNQSVEAVFADILKQLPA